MLSDKVVIIAAAICIVSSLTLFVVCLIDEFKNRRNEDE